MAGQFTDFVKICLNSTFCATHNILIMLIELQGFSRVFSYC